MKKVISAKANDDFTLDIEFNDGSYRKFDMKPYLKYPVFRKLNEITYFKNINVAFDTVQWADEQDISPDTLYLESNVITETIEV